MTKHSPVPASPASPALSDDFAKAKEYWLGAKLAAGQSAALMVLMGAELERLHKAHGVQRGGDRRGSNSQPVSLKWADLVKEHVGCSEMQAWRAREMFKASKKRVPLLNGEELLSTPIAKLPAKRQEELFHAVAKVTDGKSQAEFLRELGIAKKEQGSAAKGGKTMKAAKETAASADAGEGSDETDTPAPAAPESKIPKGWEERAHRLNTLLEEALKDGWWNDCTEAARETLHGNLIDAAAKVAATLKKGPKS